MPNPHTYLIIFGFVVTWLLIGKIMIDNTALLARLQALNTKEDAILAAIAAPSDPATEQAILDSVAKSETFATDAETKLGITPQ